MIKTVSTATKRIFTPEWEGNKDLSPAEQITVNYKAPTIALKEELFPREFNFAKGDGDAMEASMTVKVDRKRIISKMTDKINGLTASIEGVEKDITSVTQLFEAGVEFDDLVEELYTFYNNLINQKVIDEKN